jgi:S1-C subfamily serine protease
VQIAKVIAAGLLLAWGGTVASFAQMEQDQNPSTVPANQSFQGDSTQTSTPFTVGDKWEVRWQTTFGSVNVSVIGPEGSVVAGGAGTGRGSCFVPKGGTYHLQIDFTRIQPNIPMPAQVQNQNQGSSAFLNTVNGGNGNQNDQQQNRTQYSPEFLKQMSSHWTVEVVELSSNSLTSGRFVNFSLPAGANAMPATAAAASPSGTTPAAGAPSAAPVAPAPPTTMSQDQARAVVLIKGDNAEGTGFMVKTPDGPVIITNIHVIANNPNLKVTTNTGAFVTVLSEKGASDRDLAMLAIQDAGYNYLEMAPDISKTVQPGDTVITPGNSEGGEVMLNTTGNVMGIGPVRIEINNPIYHGNSGGPVFHPKSGKVLGVVTEAEAVDLSDDLDKTSFASRNSAISGKMRYFALRIDTVTAWIPIDSRRFANETAFLDQFHEQSRRLDSYLNRADHSQSGNSSSDSGNADAKIYLNDDKIMKADHDYSDQATGSDTAQHIQLLRSLLFDLQGITDSDMDQIKDKTNFYSFDQERAEGEYEYRKALRDELDAIGNNVDRLGSLPRSN